MTSEAIPDSAEVVVVGGGAIGASTAFHLAEAGAGVVLLEAQDLAGGSTSKAAGGVRAQFSTPTNVALSVRSLALFEQFTQRPGYAVDFARSGYLFLLSDQADVVAFEADIALQNAMGVRTQLITAEQAFRLAPIIDPERVLAATYGPDDGRVTPEAVVQGYVAGARRHGARVVTRCRVEGLEITAGLVRTVRTSLGPIQADTVVAATGAWAAEIGAMAGVDLPVTPQRQQVAYTASLDWLPEQLPLLIDFSSGFYAHRDGPTLLLGMADPTVAPGFELTTDDGWLATALAAGSRTIPQLADAGVRGQWAGLYDLTADHNPLLGRADRPANFLYAVGFSGHGVMHAPAVGEVMRDLVLGRDPGYDLSCFDRSRFVHATMRPERSVI